MTGEQGRPSTHHSQCGGLVGGNRVAFIHKQTGDDPRFTVSTHLAGGEGHTGSNLGVQTGQGWGEVREAS